MGQDRNKCSEIVLLIHPLAIVKVLVMVGLSFRILTSLQNCSEGGVHTNYEGVKGKPR